MRCSSCGTELPVGSTFCIECGAMVSFASDDNMGTSYDAGMPYNTGMQNDAEMQNDAAMQYDMGYNVGANTPKKPGGNKLLFMIIAALALVLVIVLVVVFATGKSDKDVKENEKEKESTEVESTEEYAMEVAEDYLNDLFKIHSVEDMEDFISEYYPSEVKREMEEEMDLDDLDDDDLNLYEFLGGVDIKAKSADELDEDDLEEIKEEVEDLIDGKLDVEWGYEVTVEMTAEDGEEKSEEDMDTYVLCVDGKCGVYAFEVDGEMEYIDMN